MPTTYTAVLDRIVDGETAVLLCEDDDRIVEEVTVDVASLPEAGRHDGAVFDVRLEDATLLEATYRPETTDERREAAQSRFDRLSERLEE